VKLGKLNDEIEEIIADGATEHLRELDERRLIKLHEKVADTAVSIECYHLALQHYHSMVGPDLFKCRLKNIPPLQSIHVKNNIFFIFS